MSGPPFSVAQSEIEDVFGRERAVRLLRYRDVIDREPRLRARGCKACWESVHLVK